MNDRTARLQPPAFYPLPLGQIRPTGWLCKQLRLQADGLSGHLDEFWPDVAESGWIGGRAEGWERGPYWLDGVVPLAFLLDDPILKGKVQRWVEYIVEHQHPDGWLGPIKDVHYGYAYDPWPVSIALKALTQYHDATGYAPIIPAMQRFLRRLATVLDEQPLKSWGHFRWADLLLSVHWLYEHTGEDWLLDLADKLRRQGFDWRAHFEHFPYQQRTRREDCNLMTHVVNNAMAIKQPGVWFRQSGDPADRQAVSQIIATLDRYHGQVTGVFSGDEHLAGKNPSQGTELCAVVEYMFSLEVMLAILGGVSFADRLERIAFNALSATLKPDLWAHQYDQQVNQVLCRVAEDNLYTNNGPDSNIFGLEPNFGCCTANMHQGWPKFAAHLWMRTPDPGLAAIAYAPCTVTTGLDGQPVRIDVQTDYPFDDTLRIVVHVEQPLHFPLYLRIPGWTENATVQVGDDAPVNAEAGAFHAIEHTWSGTTTVLLQLPMPMHVVHGYNNGVSIERGPLVYSLAVGEEWRLIGGEPPYSDWEVYPTTAWNYALQLDPRDIAGSITWHRQQPGDQPFSPEGAPVRATVKGRRVAEWQIEHNAAGTLPESPVQSSAPLEELTLLPYGCTNLRVTVFPRLEA